MCMITQVHFFKKRIADQVLLVKQFSTVYTGDRTGYLHFENESTFKLDSCIRGFRRTPNFV